MKILIAFLSAIFLIASTLQAQRIPEGKPVIVKATSTECNVCGLGAWDEFKDVIDKYKNDAVIMAVHPLELSALFSKTGRTYIENMPEFWGTPTLYVNEEVYGQFWIQKIKEYIEPYKERSVLAHPFIKYQQVDNQLNVEVKTVFLKKTNRPHYLAVYVLEDEVVEFQLSRGPEEKHSKVLRTHLGENALGTLYSEMDILANEEFTHNFTIEIDPKWKAEDLEIAAIIFEKRGETYHIINSNAAAEPILSTKLNELKTAGVNLTVQPTILRNAATIQLDLPTAFSNLNLSVINTLGQQAKSIFSGNLNSGNHTFSLNRSDFDADGIYFLVVEKEGSRMVEKIVLR